MNNSLKLLEIYKNYILKEFTSQTIDANKTIETLKSRFKNRFSDVVSYKEENVQNKDLKDFIPGIGVTFNGSTAEGIMNNIEQINQFMDSFGWFPASISSDHLNKFNNYKKWYSSLQPSSDLYLNSNKPIEIVYHPKFTPSIDIPKGMKLYHITPDVYLDKIFKNGLGPKSKGKMVSHPERVYLFNFSIGLEGDEAARFNKRPASDDVGNIVADLHSIANIGNNSPEIEKYYLLEIDTSKLSPNVKFWLDPAWENVGAVWTSSNIPPNAIETIGVFDNDGNDIDY
jgi:hypothetical protein